MPIITIIVVAGFRLTLVSGLREKDVVCSAAGFLPSGFPNVKGHL
jgi:hypothetical protein